MTGALVLFGSCQAKTVATGDVAPAQTWWRGNTHTHTLWSDGDDFPEAVAEWYKRNGYHFLAITDHNTLASSERWLRIPPTGPARDAYAKYRQRYDAGWVEERRSGDTLFVRLKGFPEYRARVEEGGRAHDYHEFAPRQRNPGRGWIMVRSSTLASDSLMQAMERGAFYASTGVTLSELGREGQRLTLEIKGDPGVSYTTQFIGTRRGYDTTSVAMHDSAGKPVTRRYSREVGAVLAEAGGMAASYVMRGDELYVRARIVSTKPKANPSYGGEVEMAWTQPVQP